VLFHTRWGGAFDDQLTFQLVGGPLFLTIASATNTFCRGPYRLIVLLTGGVFRTVGNRGGGDDIAGHRSGCGFGELRGELSGFCDRPSCLGNYYLDISGTGGTSGYGGNLSTRGRSEPSTWADAPLGLLASAWFTAEEQVLELPAGLNLF
jgi:hypothetical protein